MVRKRRVRSKTQAISAESRTSKQRILPQSAAPPKPSLFANIRSSIAPYLNGTAIADLRKSKLSALAKKAGVKSDDLNTFVEAHKQSSGTSIPSDVLFAIGKVGGLIDATALASSAPETLGDNVRSAVEAGIAPPATLDAFESTKAALVQLRTSKLSLSALAGMGRLHASDAVLGALNRKGLRTLADIRAAGGLSNIKGLNRTTFHRSIGALDAHAALSILGIEDGVRNSLIRKGIDSPFSIAKMTEREFLKKTPKTLDAASAKKLHTLAQAQSVYLVNALTGVRADLANGHSTGLSILNGKPAARSTIEEAVASPCRCRDCEAAVSPLAYLADLMRYAYDNLRHGSKVVDNTYLERTFHQPFSSLPLECEVVDAVVHQVRIAIEILRGYLTTLPAARQASIMAGLLPLERQYVSAVYEALLVRLGTSSLELRLAQNASTDAQKALADRLGLADVRQLDSTHLLINDLDTASIASLETRLERQFGLLTTRRSGSLLFVQLPEPQVLSWRRERMHQAWTEQDWPDDTPGPGVPFIDPDVIGPDDFRITDTTSNTTANAPFRLWKRRRRWVDRELTLLMNTRRSAGPLIRDILDDVFDEMKQAHTYAASGGAVDTKWPNLPKLESLRADLNSDDLVTVTQSQKTLRDKFGLTPELFDRLWSLREQVLGYQGTQGGEALKNDEWREFDSILVQARKHLLYQDWLQEEMDLSVEFGPQTFWISLKEPVEGEWPPVSPAQPIFGYQPSVDPELVKLTELPDSGIGTTARQRWQSRGNTLKTLRGDLKVKREGQGFDAMLDLALGSNRPSFTQVADWLAKLGSTIATDVQSAETNIHDKLHLEIEEFRRFAATWEKEGSQTPADRPTRSEYEELYGLLTSAQKRRQLYRTWANQDDTMDYWELLKARLPKCRARREDRSKWQRSLLVRMRPVLVDPDLLSSPHFVPPGTNLTNQAHMLWMQRQDQVRRTLTRIENQVGMSKSGLNTALQTEIGISLSDLLQIGADRDAGFSLNPRLKQLSLNPEAFDLLLQIGRLLALSGTPSLEEWQATYSILTQVWKERSVFQWREEERTLPLTLSPAYFQIPSPDAVQFPPPPRPELPQWRATVEALQDWEDKLQGRFDQEEALKQALIQAVDAAEEAALPGLRDALVGIIGGPTQQSLREKAKMLASFLLIDLQMGGCAKTTRVAQAIETLQQLLWGTRTRQVDAQYQLNNLSVFDEDWEWMGSYATWRAAVFVFLYPENLLLPSLRRDATSAFRSLIKGLRQLGSRVTRPKVQQLASEYQTYLQDVCSMRADASCEFNVLPPAVSNSPIRNVFVVGRGDYSGAGYWSRLDMSGATASAQDTWTPIPGLDAVERIVGAVPFDVNPTKRVIVVVAKAIRQGKPALLVHRFDTGTARWISDPEALELPDDIDLSGNKVKIASFEVLVKQRSQLAEPPYLVIHVPYGIGSGNAYGRSLDRNGAAWGNDDWVTITTRHQFIGDLVAAVGTETGVPGAFYLVGQSSQIGPLYRLYGLRDEPGGGQWKPVLGQVIGGLTVAGAFCWPGTDNLAVFLRSPAPPQYGVHSRLDAATVTPGPIQNGQRQDGYSGLVNTPSDFPFDITAVPPSWGGGGTTPSIVYRRAGTSYRTILIRSGNLILPSNREPAQLSPLANPVPEVAPEMPNLPTAGRAMEAQQNLARQANELLVNRMYLEEAYYFVPLLLAQYLQKGGEYIAALDVFRLVYDYSSSSQQRWVYYPGLRLGSGPISYNGRDTWDWIRDPLDPHRIARTRVGSYARFALLALIQCLLAYADSEFTHDTSESVPYATKLYQLALDLLESPDLKQALRKCDEIIGYLESRYGTVLKEVPDWRRRLEAMREGDLKMLSSAIKTIMEGDGARAKKVHRVKLEVLAKTQASSKANTLGHAVSAYSASIKDAGLAVSAIPDVEQQVSHLSFSYAPLSTGVNRSIGRSWLKLKALGDRHYSESANDERGKSSAGPAVSPWAVKSEESEDGVDINILIKGKAVPLIFRGCIPPNPVLRALLLRAECNLYKIRTCRNIAGLKRELEVYAAPTDTTSGIPVIGAGGTIILPGLGTPRPTPYRFSVLIERAKHLAQIGQQMESALLSALEKRDAEAYSVLKARQDLQLGRAGVRLQDLRIKDAEQSVVLAELQQDRAQLQFDYFAELLQAPYSALEIASLTLLGVSAASSAASGIVSFTRNSLEGTASGLGSLASAMSATASMLGQIASYERRKREWEFQRSLAGQDIKISMQQVRIAQTHVQIVGQEKAISELQVSNAEATVEFLNNKFTNVELYDWMADVLEGTYRYFLQQATSMATLAQSQLGFERQEAPPSYIQSDYWEAPSEEGVPSSPGAKAPDRRGLTGSARLLQDIYQLDQFAFETNKRKLQLSKSISLAVLAPFEFQRFRETGVLTFGTPMELFDRDFPGHYLRLIQQVRTSVIALIPPAAGLKATLTNRGVSRVVVGGDIFQTVRLHHGPDLVALTSPREATGLFEMNTQSDMLAPFENTGVDTVWEFRMPKPANPIDYNTIADIVLTIDYTALNSFDYREQLTQTLSSRVRGDRAFSFRYQFADAWYDLNNPEQVDNSKRMIVSFETRREDFPANLESLSIQHVVLYFARKAGRTFEVPVIAFQQVPLGQNGAIGGGGITSDGVLSTRRGNAASWNPIVGQTPLGKWELTLPNTSDMISRFKEQDIQDILFVISYSGRTPEWPS